MADAVSHRANAPGKSRNHRRGVRPEYGNCLAGSEELVERSWVFQSCKWYAILSGLVSPWVGRHPKLLDTIRWDLGSIKNPALFTFFFCARNLVMFSVESLGG